MRAALSLPLLACIAAFAITACGPRDADVGAAASAAGSETSVTVTATDYAFDAPAQVPAGVTTMVLVNKGRELHHVQLFRLTGGRTIADLSAALKQPGPLPSWMEAAGGPNAASPGNTSEATFMLAPGNYVMLCVIPGPDHLPHVAKGMLRSLTVTDVKNASTARPRPDLTITMTDYAFALSTAMTPGSHTLVVVNQGVLDHEAVLVRLAPGKNATDLAAWVDNQVGPPPAEVLGGLTALASGSEGYFTADFTPGHYALLCFVPDIHDGKPHIAHGMVHEFTV